MKLKSQIYDLEVRRSYTFLHETRTSFEDLSMQTQTAHVSGQKFRLLAVKITRVIARHWLAIFIVLFGILNIIPFLAPVAMRLGWTASGETIYALYSTMCHQMAQRSFFLFGDQPMYNLDELPVALVGNARDMWTLRAYLGDPAFGWKVAWSDRMVAMYGSIWIGAIIYAAISRKRLWKPIALWLFALLLLPITIDGITHFVSDLGGLTGGFRYDNRWLANLTNNVFPTSFYVGDTLGSFNSWARLVSGVLLGIAVIGLALPYLEREFRSVEQTLAEKLDRFYARSASRTETVAQESAP
jgi:uncharacterized membrane protein